MTQKLFNRILAAFVFIVAFITYLSTAQVSVSFWDCGEYLATAYGLEIPHPPGAPLFLILARVFSILPIASNIAFRMNMISVLASASAVTILYFVIIKVIENFRGKNYDSVWDSAVVSITAAIGSLAFAFAYITWWNAVETEVYATNTFVFAAIVLLLLIWNERADEVNNERFILLVAYLVGLSTSLRLMGALTIISIVMLIMFRKYITDQKEFKKTVYFFLGHLAVILIVGFTLWGSQIGIQAPTQEEYKSFDTRFSGIMVLISVLYMAVFWKKIMKKNSIYFVLVTGGILLVLIYPGVVRYLPNLLAKIVGINNTLAVLIVMAFIGVLIYAVYLSAQKNKPTLSLLLKSFLFVILGFTSYGVIIIRSGQNPPINENAPKNFQELTTYLNREQYGEWPTFQRRYSMEPHQQEIYTKYSSDLSFLWGYQMNHMMTRYILWNFAGRQNWDQDSGPNVAPFNGIANIFGPLFHLNFEGDVSKSYFGIPFLLGLIGIYYHFRKDWKMGAIFMVLFLMITYVTAYYQNQQEPQPRERIKFYGTMCFLFAMWISIGLYGLINLIKNKIQNKSISKLVPAVVLSLAFIFVPLRMYSANHFEQDRSRNWIPWDYAYNMLQSVAPNAIIFTNGDNDTFPLWYMQEVEGVRRDVRIANLSLLNTPWYIKQLKNDTPHGAEKVDMSFSDAEIEQLTPVRWEAQEISIPVPPDVIKQYGITDTATVKNGKLTWTMQVPAQFGEVGAARVQDLVSLDIIMQAKWKRPIYIAVTCSDDSKLSLDEYLSMEGMAWRLVPKKLLNKNIDYVNEPIMHAQLFNEPDGFSKSYQPGFKWRGLNDKSIYLDDNHLRLTQNYRNSFMRLAIHYLYLERNNSKVIETLDRMEKIIPKNNIPMDYRIEHDLAKIYYAAGGMVQYNMYAKDVIAEAKKRIQSNPREFNNYYNPYDMLLTHYENLHMYNEALAVAQQLKSMIPNDPTVDQIVNKFKALSGAASNEVIPKKLEKTN